LKHQGPPPQWVLNCKELFYHKNGFP